MTTILTDLSLNQLAEKIANRDVSPVECVSASLAAIERLDPGLGAFTSLYPDLALADARRAEAEILADGPKSPLHGVPLAVKDLFLVEGMRRTCGSRVHQAELCETDATAIANLRRAGAVFIGMTRLNEFAYGPTGINAIDGSARNPWNRDHACGGSSAGSACAVSARMVWGAVGSDTGGSVRIPAAHCGIAGLKPTYGRVSRHGIYPLCASFDHAGPLARTARDCGLMLGAMAGRDRLDPTTWSAAEDRGTGAPIGLSGLRFAVARDQLLVDLHPGTAACFEAALKRIEDAGARIDNIRIEGLTEALEAWVTMSLAEAFAVHRGHVEERGGELSPDVATRVEAGREISAETYLTAREVISRFKPVMAELMPRFDCIALPTVPFPALPLDSGEITLNGSKIAGAMVLGRLTRLANVTEQPAFSIPCGLTDEGLPVGLQLVGHWSEERRLTALAEAVEGVLDPLPLPPSQ